MTHRDAGLRTVLGLAAMVLAMAVTGCMTVNMDITVRPDLAMDVGMRITAPLEMADQMENFGELPGMDEVTVEQDATTRSVSGRKLLGPGEDFSVGEDPGPTIIRQRSERRLSTHYVFAMELPADQQPDQPAAPEPGADVQDQQQDREQLQAMVSGLMSTFRINVTVRLPGQIVSTGGEVVEADTVVFHLTMQDISGEEPPNLTVVSRLPNYSRLGSMTDQLITSGSDCATAGRLPLYLEAGLLPDPPADADGQYKLDTADYGRLAESIAVLEQHLPADMVTAIIRDLELNQETVGAEDIEKTYNAALSGDLRDLILRAVLSALQ